MSFQLSRACSLAYAGDAPKALAEAEEMVKAPHSLPGPDLYNLACVASLAAKSLDESGSRDRAEVAAERAIEWLKNSHALNFFLIPEMLSKLKKDDEDLEYLRNRLDFKIFLLDVAFPADPFLRPVR